MNLALRPAPRCSDEAAPKACGCRWLGCQRQATHQARWQVGEAGVIGLYCQEHAGMILAARQLVEVRISRTGGP
jgi:hypothetical protein